MQRDHAYPDRQRFLRAEQHPTRLTPFAVGLATAAVVAVLDLALRGWFQ